MSIASNAQVRILTPRTITTILAMVCIFFGIKLRNPVLLSLGIGASAMLGHALFWARRSLEDIRVRRVHQPRAFEGDFVPIELSLENKGTAVPSLLLIEDEFPPGDRWRLRQLSDAPVHQNEKLELNFLGVCNHRRNVYTLGPVRLEAFDAMGLVRKRVFAPYLSQLVVYPSAVDLAVMTVLGDGTLSHTGIETSSRVGSSEEFLGVRPYRVGDSPRSVHWPSTARANELIVREFQEDLTTDVTLFIDLGRLGLTGIGDQTSIEYAIKSAASIAKRTISKGHAASLYAIGKTVEYIPPGRGENHLLMILDRMALLKVDGEEPFFNRVEKALPYLQRGGTAVMLTSATTLDHDRARSIMEQMQGRSILPVFVLIDDRAFIKLYGEQELQHGNALSLEDSVKELVLAGARVHLVTKASSQEEALLNGLETEALSQ